MGDGEVRAEDRHRIAEDEVFPSEKDSFLVRREVMEAKETSPLLCILFAHVGQSVLDPTGVVLEADGETAARQIPLSDRLQRFIPFPKTLPLFFLLREELQTKFREAFLLLAREDSIGLLVTHQSIIG